MDNKKTVCAVVVTYNRKKLLLECLESLRSQSYPLDAIYLINNASTDQTSEFLLNNGFINEIPPKINEIWETYTIIENLTSTNDITLHYVHMNKNMGGAGGFHEGVKRAYGQGYDWLWLMDDDAEPKSSALERLNEYFGKNDVAALASAVKDVNNSIQIGHRGYFNQINFPPDQIPLPEDSYNNSIINIDMASFVGIIIKKETIKKIGFPNKEFFIYYDDLEYCIRLRDKGKILLVTNSVIVHKNVVSKNNLIRKFFDKKITITPIDKNWINYFRIRNSIIVGKMSKINPIKFYLAIIKNFLINFVIIILFTDYKFKRINLILSAYVNGLKSNFNIPKKIFNFKKL